ncbi:MAG: AMP-binding protein, partial [Bacteroidaceae bacterium]
PAGETGELWISGIQVMNGYWNLPEKTKECLIKGQDGKVYYKTGDICRIDAEGDIIYCGRKDSQIKLQGFRIELSEIEYVAKKFFDGKCRSVVIPKYGANKQCELHLVVESSHIDKAQIEEYMNNRLPFYMVPKHIHCIENFPLNNSSKIDRKKIQELI